MLTGVIFSDVWPRFSRESELRCRGRQKPPLGPRDRGDSMCTLQIRRPHRARCAFANASGGEAVCLRPRSRRSGRSFQTRALDFGLFVSTAGFQAGAFEVVEHTKRSPTQLAGVPEPLPGALVQYLLRVPALRTRGDCLAGYVDPVSSDAAIREAPWKPARARRSCRAARP